MHRSRTYSLAVVGCALAGLWLASCADESDPAPPVPATATVPPDPFLAEVDEPVDPPAPVESDPGGLRESGEPGEAAPEPAGASTERRADTIAPRGRAGRRRDREGARPSGRQAAGVTLRGESWHEFGTVPQGTVLRHTFVLDSDGEGPLTFQTAKTTCECATKAHVVVAGPDGQRTELETGDTIPAGTSFQLEVESGTSAARGPFHSNVVLYTSAPDPVHVELRATVQPVLEIDPPRLELGRLTTAESAAGTATVRSTGGQRYRLELARGTVEHFEGQLTPVDPDADGRATEWRVDVRLQPNPLLGERAYRLWLVSDLATGSSTGTPLIDFQAVELVSTVTVTEAFRARPEFLTFGRVAPGETASATVELECLGELGLPADTAIRLEEVPGTAPVPEESVAFELVRAEGGRRARLEARLLGLPAGSSGSYGALVVLAPGVEGLPVLRLRLYVSCAGD